jgi:hypothetical protein
MKSVHFVPKKNQDSDIESRLRELTERTRQTRRELEELIHHSEAENTRGFSHDKSPGPRPLFRRRRSRDGR